MKNIFLKQSILVSILLSGFSFKTGADIAVDLSYYFDTRSFNTTTFFVRSDDLGAATSFWGFTDFHSQQNKADERFEFERSFSEYRLINTKIADWTGITGLGMQVEYNYIRPGGTQVWRAALAYDFAIGENFRSQLRILPVQNFSDEQLSIGYFYRFNDRLNLAGFADYNLRDNRKNLWVVEPQLNYKVYEDTWLILEYRYNGYEAANANLDGSGWAAGIKYNLY